MSRGEGRPFVFVIPVRNPDDDKVNNYHCIEAVLHKTVESLTKQVYENIQVIVVCHRIPSWSSSLGDKITFLDVSRIPIFPPNRNPVKIDKGLKYTIGILYAQHTFKPALIMPMDSDDYVNTSLAKKLIAKKYFSDKLDGYIIKKGLHVTLSLESNFSMSYGSAYLVREFDRTCGSCRIFKIDSLMKKIRAINTDLEHRFMSWPSKSHDLSIIVPSEPVEYLSNISKDSYFNEESIINTLGRHINQDAYFRLSPLSLIGAAKGCGHGNHDGPKQGVVHGERVISRYPTEKFYHNFGLVEKSHRSFFSNWKKL